VGVVHPGGNEKRALMSVPPSKQLLRSGLDKVPGRGQGEVVLEQVLRTRVLKGGWPTAERSR
jgi:hypothetical protein